MNNLTFEQISQLHVEAMSDSSGGGDKTPMPPAESLFITKVLSGEMDHMLTIFHFAQLGARYECEKGFGAELPEDQREKLNTHAASVFMKSLRKDAENIVNDTQSKIHEVFLLNEPSKHIEIARALITSLFESGRKWAIQHYADVDIDTLDISDEGITNYTDEPNVPSQSVEEPPIDFEMDDDLRDQLSNLLGDF